VLTVPPIATFEVGVVISAREPSATGLPFASVAETVRVIFSPGAYDSLSSFKVTTFAVEPVTSTVVVPVTVDVATVLAFPNVITEVPAATPTRLNVATPVAEVVAEAAIVAVASVPLNA